MLWVSSDGGVDLLEEVLDAADLGGSECLSPLSELSLEGFLLVLEQIHIFVDVSTQNSVSVGLWEVLPLLGLLILLGSVELSGAMWNMDSTVTGTLQGGEHSVADAVVDHTHIEDGLERSLGVLERIGFGRHIVVNTVGLLGTLVDGVELELLEQSSGDEQTGGVSSGVAGLAGGESPLSELGGGGLAQNFVTLGCGVDDLGQDLLVGESDNQSVLWSTILVSVLGNHSLSGLIVGLAFSASSELSLESFIVSSSLLNLYESLSYEVLPFCISFGFIMKCLGEDNQEIKPKKPSCYAVKSNTL